jgi:predicted MFS family arabinose efflux permease
MVPAIVVAERFSRMKLVFNAAIVILLAVQAGFGLFAGGLYSLAFWLMLFFVAFNILEATQPSLISRIAPPHAKGAALGVYNTTQALGLFLGGVCGGVLAKYCRFGCGLGRRRRIDDGLAAARADDDDAAAAHSASGT